MELHEKTTPVWVRGFVNLLDQAGVSFCRNVMLVQIKQSTGLCMKSILAVLEAEHKYLDSIWGTDDDDSDEEDNA